MIKQNTDELHYSHKLFVNGIYINNFVNPSCYVDSYNQRIIKYISDVNDYKQAKEMFEQLSHKQAKEMFEQLSHKKVKELNQSIEYVGIEDFKVKCKRR